MLKIGVQTKNVVYDANPQAGFAALGRAGFSGIDFSLNGYLKNTDLYQGGRNSFFDRSISELEHFFAPHKAGAKAEGIDIHQMHMPYPIYVPSGKQEINDYLWHVVAPKSMQLCSYLKCRYIVVHGFKLARFLGSEDREWEETETFLHFLAPMAKEMGITVCIENLYDSVGGHLMEGPCCDAKKAKERIDRINDRYHAEVLGFCFDTGHANLIGLDFEAFITTLDYRLKVLHIHDNDGIADLHQIPFTFTKTRDNRSSTDWDGLIRGLRTVSFDQMLSFETAPVLEAFPVELKQDVLEFLFKIGGWFAKNLHEVAE